MTGMLSNGDASWFFDGEGRLFSGQVGGDTYEPVANEAVAALMSEGLTLDDVEYVSFEGRTYSTEQFERFTDYYDWCGGCLGSMSLVGKGFYTTLVSGQGFRFHKVCFEDKMAGGDKGSRPSGYDPPERKEITDAWGLGEGFSERNHLWPMSGAVRDYSVGEMADRVLKAMVNMRADSKRVPDKVYAIMVPQCREPILMEGKGGAPSRGYLQAAFDTRVHVFRTGMEGMFGNADRKLLFSPDMLE